jgi:hypothetical protein
MAATSMLFSWVVLEGLTQLGITIEPHEADDYMQLWRYVSHLLGVDPEVSPTSASEARRLGNLIMATQEPPDDDSRALTRALMDAGLSEARSAAERTSAERRRHFAHAVCRELTGDSLADGLAIERTGWRTAVFALKRVVRTTEKVRTSLRRANTRAILSGERYWDRVVSIGLEGATAEFRLPDRLLSA